MVVNLSGRGDKDMETVAARAGSDAVSRQVTDENNRRTNRREIRRTARARRSGADSVHRRGRSRPRGDPRAGARIRGARRGPGRARRAIFRSDGRRASQSARARARAGRGCLAGRDSRDGQRSAPSTPRFRSCCLATTTRSCTTDASACAPTPRAPASTACSSSICRPRRRRSSHVRPAPTASISSICSRRPRRSSACARDRARGQRLSLLRLGDRRDRRAHQPRRRARDAACAPCAR